jgi:hypothetical protein
MVYLASEIKLLTPLIKSLRATLPAEIFLPGILIFKQLTARRLDWSFGVHHHDVLEGLGFSQFLNPQDEVGPSISSLVVLCFSVL